MGVNDIPIATGFTDTSGTFAIDFNDHVSDVDGDVLSYSISSGSLPSGLTLGTDGIITGRIAKMTQILNIAKNTD